MPSEINDTDLAQFEHAIDEYNSIILRRAAPRLIAALRATREREDRLRKALEHIASCEVRFTGDVVDVARAALAEYETPEEPDA